MSHTKGPWNVTYKESTGTYYIEKSKGNDLRLVSAAPEMLEALKMALSGLKYRSVENYFSIEAVESAIKKAEGES